jgi:DNA-binding transcriptional regulator GbsR (MarR family)
MNIKYLNFVFKSLIMIKDEMLELKRPLIDACIKSAQTNGWSDAMGVLRGTLFLESEPVSLDMLAEKTGYSKTSVRLNLTYLENLGIVRRVVGPLGKQHRYKQHRYALVNDAEAMRSAILSVAKAEIHLILQALLQTKKNLDDSSMQNADFEASLAKAIQFYEEMSRVLDVMGQFTSKELIEILEGRKRRTVSL